MRYVHFASIALLLIAGAVAQYSSTTAESALQFCKTAYCNVGDIQSWSCGPACQFHSDFQLQGAYHNSSIDSQAFTGYSPSLGMVVVAFRGSSNIENWISDLNFFKTEYPNPDCGCEVHEGFLGEWMSLVDSVLSDVSTLVQQHNAPVFITGHSLGAAVSLLAAMDVITKITSDVTVYNFGEPRVGDDTFAAWAANRIPAGKQFRVTHSRDPVPHVPPELVGFLHAPHELWYDNDGDTQWTDCQDSATAEDDNCSDSVIPYGIDDHLLYLGICTECTCSSEHLTAKYGKQRAQRIMERMNAKKSTSVIPKTWREAPRN